MDDDLARSTSFRFLLSIALLSPWVCVSAGAQGIAVKQFEHFHVVLAADTPEPEQVAATRFIEHWRQTSGFEPTQSTEPIPEAVNVWIGSAAQQAFPADFSRRNPTADGCFVLTLPARDGIPGVAHLLTAGGGPRGTLYAEWSFFERFLGVRAYAPGFIHYPKRTDDIPRIDWRYEPPFEYRDSNYREFLVAPWLASVNHLNGQWSAVPERLGGHIGFVHGLVGHGHTFHNFVNPEEYFDEHPEYFAEINGERIKQAQLCLTNPDVLAITIDRARQFLREAAPHERILSVSQMDYYWFDSWCTCEVCSAVDDAEGSHSGTIVRFVNAVAEAIEGEFPGARIDTFAYQYSRKPPKLTRPRDNVLIRLCAIEVDYGRPMGDRRSPENRSFVRDLKAWRRIAKHLWVWDYTQNWTTFQAPHPNVHVLQPNLALYAKLGVDGVFEQASPHSPHSDFEFLKGYLLGRGLRDPQFDWKTEYHAFLDAYYGPAARYLDEYQRLLRDRVLAWGGPLRFANSLLWIDTATVNRAQEIFARAFSSTNDPMITERLRAAYLPVQYAALVCPPRIAQTPDAYVFTRPASPTFDEYWAELNALGVTHLNDYPIEQLRERMGGKTPPRYEEASIEKLRNDRFDVWIVPARGGAVVRWRERNTGRDWMKGYDMIRYPRSRIQDWITTDQDRWAEPDPVQLTYTVVERGDGHIVLRTELENGLVLQKRISLVPEGLDMACTFTNTSTEGVVPKIAQVAEYWTGPLGKPTVWTRGDYNHAFARTQTPPDAAARRGVALRFVRARRTVSAEVSTGEPGDTISVQREDRSAFTTVRVDFDRRALAPGESREVLVRHTISARKPDHLLAEPSR